MFMQLEKAVSLGEHKVYACGCYQRVPNFGSVHSEHDYFRLRHHAFEHARCFHAVQEWHGEIEQNQIRLKLLCFFYYFRAVCCLAANGELSLAFHKRA